MLNHVDFNRHMTDIEYRLETREVRGELAQLQHRMKESKLPVIVLFEGWDSSGKGSMIASMIQTLDPRFFKVYNTKDPTPEEQRYPFLWRHWRRTPERDQYRNKHYKEYYRVYDEMLEKTNTVFAPWHIISAQERRSAMNEIYQIIVQSIRSALDEKKVIIPSEYHAQMHTFHLVKKPLLEDVPLYRSIDEDVYRNLLHKEQKKLAKLHNIVYRKRIPVIVAYEGWDAAGKGGNIKRLTAALDPRGYEVVPIASPTPTEKAHNHLWRFWQHFPEDGHITVFDRTWYGRVMVERLEGFCTEEEWKRAYQEINELEYELQKWGAILIKFWLHIDSDEQLRRFKERQETPEKQWKITDEDWRNREKWDQYETAVNDMIRLTSTEYAPWTIVESQDKKFGRIKAIQTLNDAIEARI